MKKTLLLFLSAGPLHAQFMAGGKLATQRDFPNTAEGYEQFADFLKAAACPAYMLVDLIEEDFRQETIPHLIGSKRTALLQRKLEQFYRGTPFRQATLLQRQKTGRRDDDMLFSALTNPSLITPWVNILLTEQIPVAGIYSVPQISVPLIKDHPSEHLLLISWEKYSGLRQTYFNGHRLQISRLTPLYAELSFHSAVVKELARTHQYLKSLSLLPEGQILDVRILCHCNDIGLLKAELPDSQDMRYDFADLENVGARLDVDHVFADSDASQIFLQNLATRRPTTHYANAGHTRFFTMCRSKRVMNMTSGAMLAGALAWSTVNLWQSSDDAAEAEILKSQVLRTLSEAQKITLGFPETPASPADMQSAVTVMHRLESFAPDPADVLKPVSKTLDRYQRIVLDDLGWRASATEPVAPGTVSDVPAQVITVKGRVVDFASDFRGMLTYLDRFQNELTVQGYKITPLAWPLDISPGGSIVDKREAGGNEAGFSLSISRRPPA